jgi:hypothetical protein
MAGTSWNQDEFMRRVRAGALTGLSDWIGIVENEAVRLIMEPPKTGKIYSRRGVQHQASAPGEAPASDTGRLVNSRRTELIAGSLRARLNFSTAYALPLELGTKRMEPRPYARRALAETEQQGLAAFRAAIAAALK